MCTEHQETDVPLDLPCDLDQGLGSFILSVSFFVKEPLRIP